MQILAVRITSEHPMRDAGDELVELLCAAGASRAESALIEPGDPEGRTAAVDAALDRREGRRLVIAGDLAGLQLVLARLMRRGELGTAETAVLPEAPVGYLDRIGLPRDTAARVHAAVHAPTSLVGVIKDDSGGLCVDHADVEPWQPQEPWWVRAVVDDQRLVDGAARSVTVRRLGPSELEARVQRGRVSRRTLRGRSLQLACDDARVTQDGLARERPRGKRTFWSEPLLWRLALPDTASGVSVRQ